MEKKLETTIGFGVLEGVPIVRIIVFCGSYWGPTIWGN